MGNIDFILNLVATIIIPLVALFFAWRGIKAWQIDKIMSIHSNIKFHVEKILNYNTSSNNIDDLYIDLLEQLEILAMLIKRQYLFIDNKLKKSIFNTYIKNCYESKYIKEIIDEAREDNPEAYLYFEKLYHKWNK